jgi:hypothetical protein
MGGLVDYKTESLTLDHIEYRVWRVPCSLHAQDLCCRFRKIVDTVAATKNCIFFPYFLSGSQKPLTHPVLHFYMVFIYY